MVELVDTRHLKRRTFGCKGSSPFFRTNNMNKLTEIFITFIAVAIFAYAISLLAQLVTTVISPIAAYIFVIIAVVYLLWLVYSD